MNRTSPFIVMIIDVYGDIPRPRAPFFSHIRYFLSVWFIFCIPFYFLRYRKSKMGCASFLLSDYFVRSMVVFGDTRMLIFKCIGFELQNFPITI